MSYDKDKMTSELNKLADKINSVTKSTGKKTIPEMREALNGVVVPEGLLQIQDTEIKDVSTYSQAQVVDNNLIAENIKKDVNILGVTGTLSSGDTTQEDGLVERTLTTYSNDRVTKIGDFAFRYCTKLTSVDLPNVTSIGQNAFSNCDSLTSVDFPLVTDISKYGIFQICKNLVSVNLPLANSSTSYTFEGCSSLKNINLPLITSFGQSMFSGCKSLTNVDSPSLKVIKNDSFHGCDGLTSVDFPLVTDIGSNGFRSCKNLTSVYISNAKNISSYTFDSCYSLTKLVIRQTEKVCTLQSNSFGGCYHFTGTTNATYNPNGLKDGRIYVPDELVDSYKAATNWSTYADIIVPLSTLVEE